MIKGMLFDFNGTLFYDSDKHISAVQKFFSLKGLPVPSEEDVVLKMFGKTNRNIFKEYYRDDATEEELDAYGKEKEALYRESCLSSPETFHLLDGVYEMLDYLKENGIPYNLATGSPIDNLEFYFEYMDLWKWFSMDRVVYDDGSIRGKPAPDMYIEAARRIGLMPQECIVFEDSASGIKAARAAGVGAVYAVVADELSLPFSEDLAVDGEIKDFKNYAEILNRYGIIGKDTSDVCR